MSDSLSGTDALSSTSPCKTTMSISLYFIPLRSTGITLNKVKGGREGRGEGRKGRKGREGREEGREGEGRGNKKGDEGRKEQDRGEWWERNPLYTSILQRYEVMTPDCKLRLWFKVIRQITSLLG